MIAERVLAFLQAQGMQPGAHAVVGLSGGADSVCLLHVLQSLDTLPLRLTAVHVNHGLRGEEAARDERFCRQFCGAHGIAFLAVHVDVPAESAKTGEGHEACGRRLRYAAFRKAAGEDGYILTAHTADDNAETVLLHLLRGTGLSGLCGIPPVRGNILRPLLSCTRADVEQYCAQHDLTYMTDSTNESDLYLRNRMRREVLPILKTMNPSALEAFSRMTEAVRVDEAFLKESAQEAAKTVITSRGVDEQALLKLPPALQRRVLYMWLCTKTHSAKHQIESVHVEALLALVGSGKRMTLPGAYTVRSRRGFLECPPPAVSAWEQPLQRTEYAQTVQTPAGTIHIQLFLQKDLQNLHKEYLANAVDCAKMNSNLVLRSRRCGDRFSDSARGISKTLKKWMNEQKIPPELRNAVPVLASGDQVLWVGGFGANAPFAVSAQTRQCFVFMFEKDGGNTNEK